MNKRDALLDLLQPEKPQAYVPAAFFIHFGPRFHFGQAAVERHLEYVRYTDMDLVKIQYERKFPYQPQIRRPEDWGKLPLFTKAFFQPQLDAVAGLVKAAKGEALVIVTLYSAFMCAAHASGGLIVDHLNENPAQAGKGLEIAAASLQIFVRECVRLGVDGFYASTQGGERGRLADPSVFRDYVKPFDLLLLEEIDRACPFNILHVCDYKGGYDDLTPFLDYPGDVVNCNPRVGAETLSAPAIAALFGRPFMGGLDRLGVIATGSEDAVARAVEEVVDNAPYKFMLGADCTLPNDVRWDNVRAAVAAAHRYRSDGS